MNRQSFLILIEGESREEKLIASLKHCNLFPVDNKVVAYCGDLYQLYKKLDFDSDIDLIGLLKEQGKLDNQYERDSFSEIYLFFDYDPHSQIYRDENGQAQIQRELVSTRLLSMLDYFDDEVERGKIFISYPMVEAIRLCQCAFDLDVYKDCSIDYSDAKNFKQISNHHALNPQFNYAQINVNDWYQIIDLTCKKANYLVNELLDFPNMYISQRAIFDIQNHDKIYTLPSFPLMLLGYYGVKRLKEKVSMSDRPNIHRERRKSITQT